MSRLGPIITLSAGAVLVAGLGVASVAAAPAGDVTGADVAVQAEATSTPTPIKSARPERPTPVKADYGGYVKGNGGLIAISVRDGKVVGYFCDGRTEAWFKGRASDGRAGLKGFGGASVTASFGGGKATGTLAVGGRKWTFSAPVVKKPSGLYRATAQVRGARIRAGWIVLPRPDGDGFVQVGVAAQDDRPIPTPTLTPGQPVVVDGTQVQPQDVDGFIEEMS